MSYRYSMDSPTIKLTMNLAGMHAMSPSQELAALGVAADGAAAAAGNACDSDTGAQGYKPGRSMALPGNLANNVLRLRKAKGISRAELCRRSSLRANSLYNIEVRHVFARLDTIEKLAWALDVQPSELLL